MSKGYTLSDLQSKGSSSEKILLSLLGHVYEVTPDFFGPNGPYRVYAGHDATYALSIMSMDPEDLDKFSYTLQSEDVQTLADWIAYFDVKYGRVGYLTDRKHQLNWRELPKGKDPSKLIAMAHPVVETENTSFQPEVPDAQKEHFRNAVRLAGFSDERITINELNQHDCTSNKMLISLLGNVYDVSSAPELFSSKGAYRKFCGHDITYALSVMSLEEKDMDVFNYELDKDEMQTLANWILYFESNFTKVGSLDGATHSVSADSLPVGQFPAHLRTNIEKHVKTDNWINGSADSDPSRRLSRWLIQETNDLHELALHGDFMQAIMKRTITRKNYGAWLYSMHCIYLELELQLEKQRENPLIQAIDDTRLRRLRPLEEDLIFFFGPGILNQVVISPTLHTVRYVSRISDISDKPHRLIVHHWMRYGGDLSGGQFLKASLKHALNLQSKVDGTCPGIRYHQFDEIPDIQTYYDSYLRKLDDLEVTETIKMEMLEEARIAFNLNIKLNDEFVGEASQSKQLNARL